MKIFEYLIYSYILYEYNICIISTKFEINLKSCINVLKINSNILRNALINIL